MSSRKSYKFELAIILGAVGVLGIFFGGLLGLSSWVGNEAKVDQQSVNATLETEKAKQRIEARLSKGHQSLLPNPSEPKQQGIAAYASGEYEEAVLHFEAALQVSRNDPETLIYLNNARIGNEKSHTLAVIAPVGTTSEIGLEILRGVAHAQQAMNLADEANQVPITVLIANDENDPAIAKVIAKHLSNDPTVLGVVGHYSSGVTLAAAPIYDQEKLPIISAISTSVELSGMSPYVFRTVPSDSFAATSLAQYMMDGLGAQRAILYYDSNSAYSLSLKSEFATSVFSQGGEVILEYDLADPNFDAAQQLQVAQAQNADLIMLASSTDTLEPSLAVMDQNNQTLPMLGGDDLYHPQILEGSSDHVENLVVAVPWHVLADSDSEFVQTSRDLWGGDVSWRTAMAYDAFASFGAALAQAPSREGIRQSLETADFQTVGATGTVQFLPSGDRNRAAQLVQIQSGQNSNSGLGFVPIE